MKKAPCDKQEAFKGLKLPYETITKLASVQPLSRNNAIGETSFLAALAATKKAVSQRARVYVALAESGEMLTPEEITARLNEAGFSDLLQSVRPRCSELARLGLIEDSGLRGKGFGGCKSIKWRIKPIGGAHE